MKKIVCLVLAVSVGGCAAPPQYPPSVLPPIHEEMDRAAAQKAEAPRAALPDAGFLPPLRMEMPSVRGQPIDQRFDLSVTNAPAPQVFMSIVSGTRYSMLIHPEVSGSVSLNLKDVTVREAMESIREMYGYEFSIEGTRIHVQSISIQTRVFQVNYLIGQRYGRSDIRVTSGSVGDAPNSSGAPGQTSGAVQPAVAAPNEPGGGVPGVVNDSSRIQTQTKSDFWHDLERTLRAIVGTQPGRNVVVNPQAGVVVVRALPTELRGVEAYLKAIRLSVERQVVLEAKIIEVTLNSQYQTGVNWAAFSGSHVSAGQVSPGTLMERGGGTSRLTTGSVTNPTLGSFPGKDLINFALPGASLFGLAIQAGSFAALLTFLESQGSVQVLSSPRIATMNNQKAVLKVGTDQFFLTSISGSSTTTATTTTGATTPAFPAITLRPFFSGVALDITPQIDDNSNVILHIHPSVSDVQTDNRQIDLGASFGGVVSLPVAKSNVSETDSVVKIVGGSIVAIGGLMKVDFDDGRSGLPGVQESPVGGLFSSRTRRLVKKELVILIKPTVIQSGNETLEDIRQSRERILQMMPITVPAQ